MNTKKKTIFLEHGSSPNGVTILEALAVSFEMDGGDDSPFAP
uniref:Uncharacterized protein n=1 Tax=Nelumbo nucifera TaxID=4432 RepID=A0A822ZJ35_NELNU|nr:TPA_asm: hypothetical protein HUJ06_001695 [Nelumbo nucifera]